jgi:tetrapyrrole methylase family protein / MazG family protein
VSRPRVVVGGLGPATSDLVTAATLAAIDRIPHRFLRTRRHPSAGIVGLAVAFDTLYDAAETFDEVYDGVVERLVAAAEEHGEVLYAVPGSPTVAESTVDRLRADGRVDVELLPAVSFLDLAWPRLGIDPLDAGVRLVDGHRFDTEAAGERGPLLVAQCDNRDVLSAVKLALGELVDASTEAAKDTDTENDTENEEQPTVTVLQRLGLNDERVVEVRWDDLDRTVEPDHLTSLYVPRLAAPVAGEVARFDEVVRRLRAECPWDREQTHQSLRRHLLEESYEVLEAIDHVDVDAGEGFDELEEELGDLLFQIVFHATLAAEEGRFTLADVARGISEKLIGRHPHVFGDVDIDSVDELVTRWDQMKKVEKGRESVMDGIPATLPALLYALKVQRRAGSEGFAWQDLLAEPAATEGDEQDPEERQIGERLLALVDEAERSGVDPESALRLAAETIRDRCRARERARAQVNEGADLP